MDLDEANCRRVLQRYPAALGGGPVEDARIERVRGGFSGARVWRVRLGAFDWCLRRWPRDALPPSRLAELHRWLQFLRDLGGVPVAVPAPVAPGGTLLLDSDGVWQLEPWLPGVADFRDHPTPDRLANAMRILARLHITSARYAPSQAGRRWFQPRVGPSPAVAERIDLLGDWTDPAVHEARLRLEARPASPLREAALEGLERSARLRDSVRERLSDVSELAIPLFACLRDVWHDHVLFTGELVSGLVDPAAARTESVAADLSRLLSSLVGHDAQQWAAALDWYAEVRPLSAAERRLTPVLGLSNVLLSTLHWIERIAADDPHAQTPAAEARLHDCVSRLRAADLVATL